MKKLIVSIVLLISVAPAAALAATPSSQVGLKITEVYMGSSASGSDEYIIVTNVGTTPIEVNGISLDYKSATGKSWYSKAEVKSSRQLAPYTDLTFAVTRAHDYELKSGMAQTAGNVRLQAADSTVLDQLAWGIGDTPEGQAASAPKAGEALARICDDAAKTCQDSDDNMADFRVTNVDVPAGKGSSTGSVNSGDEVAGDESADLEITEIFPDPVSPQSDSKDEFVEIYNGGAKAANLSGWKLVDAGGHVTKLTGSIAAGGYLALYAPQTKLSLNNSGDTVSLVSPSGVIVMTTPNYGKAKAGKTFGATPVGWGWLNAPTPGGVNTSLSSDQSDTTSTTTKKVTASKTTKKSSSAKAKAKTPALAKTAASSKNGSDGIADALSSTVPWTWLLAGMGVIAVGYGVYEYRPEILSYYAKLRAKFSLGK